MVTMLISSAKECEDQAPSYLGFSIDVMPKDVFKRLHRNPCLHTSTSLYLCPIQSGFN